MTDTKLEGEPMMGRRSTDRPYERDMERDDDRRADTSRLAARPAEAKIVTAARDAAFAVDHGVLADARRGDWTDHRRLLGRSGALARPRVTVPAGMSAYILSRGFAKAGSGEPVIRNVR